MEKNRKLILLVLFAFILFFIGYMIFIIFNNKPEVPTSISRISPMPTFLPSPTIEIISVKERISAGGVSVRDIYQFSEKKFINNDLIIRQNNDFLLTYNSRGNYFHLSIINSPFEEVKLRSEKEFLRLLDISESDACRLKLTITTPFSANRQESGQDYPLSFCQ